MIVLVTGRPRAVARCHGDLGFAGVLAGTWGDPLGWPVMSAAIRTL